ncbi:MAG: HAD family hydrolase, partial [Eubacterium sp.]|nr:HAD family hydrolase [Eubacterium sp.]
FGANSKNKWVSAEVSVGQDLLDPKKSGFKMAIVSNKIDSAVKELNDRFFSEYVDSAIGEKEGVRRKPAPDTVLSAMEELGSDPGECIYVGDSEVDLQTAKNAGIPCISVLWGFRDRDYLVENGATVLAEKPADVLELVLRRNQPEM